MAQITGEPATSQRQRRGVGRMKKHAMRIDMTPMVDLGFLLITFFVITAELSEPRAMDLAMPKDSQKEQNELGKSYALTVLLDGEKNYYYEGSWEDALQGQGLQEIGIRELRDVIIRKQKILDDTTRFREGRRGLMLLIKPGSEAIYETLVDALDEAVINGVEKYAVIKLSEEEKDWLRQRK